MYVTWHISLWEHVIMYFSQWWCSEKLRCLALLSEFFLIYLFLAMDNFCWIWSTFLSCKLGWSPDFPWKAWVYLIFQCLWPFKCLISHSWAWLCLKLVFQMTNATCNFYLINLAIQYLLVTSKAYFAAYK